FYVVKCRYFCFVQLKIYIMNAFRLEGKKALVTGGGSGIGFGIAKTFVQAGAKVLIVGRNEEKLINAKNMLGKQCKYLSFDVSNLEEIPAFVQKIEKDFGALDVLVNCAGTHLKKNAVDTTDRTKINHYET
ncbi:MAG: SDR family NAD(P)-dependent oxidoreductase, partial [Wenyingzhuangia sp.]